MTTTRKIGNSLNSAAVQSLSFTGKISSLPNPLDDHSIHIAADSVQMFSQVSLILSNAIEGLSANSFLNTKGLDLGQLPLNSYSVQLMDGKVSVAHDNTIESLLNKLIEEYEIEAMESERIIFREPKSYSVLNNDYYSDSESISSLAPRTLDFSDIETSDSDIESKATLPKVAQSKWANLLLEEKNSSNDEFSAESSESENSIRPADSTSSDSDSDKENQQPNKRRRNLDSLFAKASNKKDEKEIELRHKISHLKLS
ncbi:MAG TPA: hypothetical protein VHA13_00280 [Gammaproteobacteria bacterium]|nr:hypothetical protein [Gammaproteobacteria bacterium]